jgi:hypothetical protein
MKNKINAILFISLFYQSAWAAELVIPNTFVPNSPAKASEVNENFGAVRTVVNQHETKVTAQGTAIADIESRVDELETITPTPRNISIASNQFGIVEGDTVLTRSFYGMKFPYYTTAELQALCCNNEAFFSMSRPKDYAGGNVVARLVFLIRSDALSSRSFGFRLGVKSYSLVNQSLSSSTNSNTGTSNIQMICTDNGPGCLEDVVISIPESQLNQEFWTFKLTRTTTGENTDDLYFMSMSLEYDAF